MGKKVKEKSKKGSRNMYDYELVISNMPVSLKHKIEFNIEQTVYLRTDKEQNPHLVTGIILRPFNSVTYALTENNTETYHYGFEICNDRDIVMATSN